ncbi:MAG: phenylacetate--CoA ligase family protein [Planctomycetota bacterium]|nr:MAG: phenylacetate--CoA ligase family protein [Planctomycetota bacterium]
MNWRKPLIYFLLYATGSKIPKYLEQIKKCEYLSAEQLEDLTNNKLEKLLLHAYNNVPYYHRTLSECGAILDGRVILENFQNIPILTKEIIRNEGEKLYSKDYENRKPYKNTSGGSTGEPVEFVQDKQYDQWNTAIKLYFNSLLGKEPGEGEIKLWGSDRDIIKGTVGLKERIINFLYNRKFFNSYRFGSEEVCDLIELNNRFKPTVYWSYMESALELAKYLQANDKHFLSPKFAISTIGPLAEDVQRQIEEGMQCKVYNQYGSREVGGIACQCRYQGGLHTFPWFNYVEVVGENSKTIQDGEGEVLVTTLENYSMPLIRYEIGDAAVVGDSRCLCGRNSFQLKKVIGRTLGYFKKSDGSLVHSHFIVQSLFFRSWLKQFQIIQDRMGHISIKLELHKGFEPSEEDVKDIKKKTRILMGQNCEVEFVLVDKIERSPSGKYLYTICEI